MCMYNIYHEYAAMKIYLLMDTKSNMKTSPFSFIQNTHEPDTYQTIRYLFIRSTKHRSTVITRKRAHLISIDRAFNVSCTQNNSVQISTNKSNSLTFKN